MGGGRRGGVGAPQGGKEKPIEDAPVLVFHKVMLLGAMHALVSALAAGTDALAVFDDA